MQRQMQCFQKSVKWETQSQEFLLAFQTNAWCDWRLSRETSLGTALPFSKGKLWIRFVRLFVGEGGGWEHGAGNSKKRVSAATLMEFLGH